MIKPFFIKNNAFFKRADPLQILTAEIEKNYVKIFMTDLSYFFIRCTLSGLYKKLPKDIFVRVNRSAIVSIFHIDEIWKDHLVIREKPIPIERIYRDRFFSLVQIIE